MEKERPNTSAWLGILSRVSGKQIFLMAFIELYFMVGCSKTTTPTSITPTITLEFPSATVIHRFTASVTATLLPVDTLTPPRPASTLSVNKKTSSAPTAVKERSSTPSPTMTAAPIATFNDPRKSLAPGQYVVFWRQNTWYVQGLDGAPPIRLMPVESLNSPASLSPDGEKIAFTTTSDEIAIYNLSTGEQTTYTDLILRWVTRFDWSPDSKILLAGGFIGGPYGLNENPTGEFDYEKVLYAIWLQENKLICLGCEGINAEKGYYGEDPAWSPNSNWIAWISRVANSPLPFTKNLYLMDANCIEDLANCSDRSLVLDETAWAAPKWSWDGRLASSCIKDGKHGICVLDITGDKSPQMVVDIDNLTKQNEMLQDFDWSPDGDHLVFTVRYGAVAVGPIPKDAYTDVWVASVQGGELINLSNTPDRDEWSNGWSPDGAYVAFSRTFGLEPLPKWESAYAYVSDIYIVPSGGGEAVNLTNTPDVRETFAFWMFIPTPFQPGSKYQITTTGNDLNLRVSPSRNGIVLEKLKTGDTVTILEGPVQADKFTWWKMRAADGVEGWAVDVAGWYAPVNTSATPTLTPTP